MAVVITIPNRSPVMLTVSEVARRLGANPRDISNLFYVRKLRDDLCPIVGGRRLIPDHYLAMIAMALRRAGKNTMSPSTTHIDAAPATEETL